MNGDPKTFIRIVSTVGGDNLAWPNALTIDYFTNKIWWADAHLVSNTFYSFLGANYLFMWPRDKVRLLGISENNMQRNLKA
jgi:hypothetical protein